MQFKQFFRSYSLLTQLVVSYLLLAVLTAIAVGLPAILTLRGQLQRQVWTQVENGRKTTQSSLAAWQTELNQLATLTSQRPTLQQLAGSADDTRLIRYLNTLKTGAGVDLVAVCGLDGDVVGISGVIVSENLCTGWSKEGFYIAQNGALPVAWLLSGQQLPSETGSFGFVVIGKQIDQKFLTALYQQTGFEQMILFHGQPLATSLHESASFQPAGDQSLLKQPTNSQYSLSGRQVILNVGQNTYYGIQFPYDQAGVEMVSAIPVDEILLTQQRLSRNFVYSILLIAAAGSLLGVIIARGIIRPLKRVEKAAIALKKGNLSTPISLDIHVKEVSHVAQTLDDTRSALLNTLQELNRQKAWTEHLLESIVEGIVTLDDRGRVMFFSQGAERVMGLQQESVLGRRCDDVIYPAEEKSRFSDFIPAPGQRSKVVVRRSDQQLVTLSITGAKFTMPEISKDRVVLVLRDVSDEEGMRRLLGDFLANVTHEFRTPLSALAASIELLMEQLPDLSTNEVFELLNPIQLSIFGLQTLIDNLLEGASIETGQFKVVPKPVQIEEIIYKNTGLLEPLVKKYHQYLTVSIPGALPPVRADVRRTSQILVNLISNAIKNSPEGGEITVQVSREEGFLCVEVADRGLGIPARVLPGVFARYMHFPVAEGRSETGAGLGLSVVKAIAEAQGGQVGVKNQPDGGAVFWFTLPVIA